MDKSHKWRMNRAGLFNFWYYDEEVFEFSNGKLLLRGSNGSGKSVTMQSILPVLLDGRKSPDRLDPFGSKARRIEDYLLGEKDIVDRDERTGYLFLEYKREDTDQYITTGIGMQARRNKGLSSWYFIITDNRRIGHEFLLYEWEYNGGEKQKIPLTRIQLENRIADGGYVVRSQKEYMSLVNKYIFGFAEIEAFEDLIKLLIQLRSPKLSKDFKPTVIYEILEAALPPLTDEDLRHLSDTIENMDQTKLQIEQFVREIEALSKLVKRYDTYNEYQLAEKAFEYLQSKKQYEKDAEILAEKQAEEKHLKAEIFQEKTRSSELEQSIQVLDQKKTRLVGHKVWNLEKEKIDEQNRLSGMERDASRKDQQLSQKKQQELIVRKRSENLEAEISQLKTDMDDALQELAELAEDASFSYHKINEGDFLRNSGEPFDFTLWKRETENHFQMLDEISEQFRKYEDLKKKVAEHQKRIADLNLELDIVRREEKDWLDIFEKDKQEKLHEIYVWKDQHSNFKITDEAVQQTARLMDQLYEPHPYEKLRTIYHKAFQDYQMEINQQIAAEKSKLESISDTIAEKHKELEEWKAKRDPEPPGRSWATVEARRLLKEKNVSFVPFFEAVEFQDHVSEDIRNRIEAALLDAGILDALIADSSIPVHHDKVIRIQPQIMVHTLAEYLRPDIGKDSLVSVEIIEDALSSILVNDDMDAAPFVIHEDGSYQIGLLRGHASPVETVRFIGKTARERFREEQINQLREEINQLEEDKSAIMEKIQHLYAKIDEAQLAMEQFPNDKDLQESFKHIQEARFRIERLDQERSHLDERMKTVLVEYKKTKRDVEEKTRGLNIEQTLEAYIQAKNIMRFYEKKLALLIQQHQDFCHRSENLVQAKERIDELMMEVDELSGELNVLRDKIEMTKKNIREIVQQLELEGVEEVRKQIQEVQNDLREANEELEKLRTTIPQKQVKHDSILQEIHKVERKMVFNENMIAAWREAFSKEVHYEFIKIPTEIDSLDEKAKWVEKNYKSTLKEKDRKNIETQLTNVYYEQYSNLLEFRMNEIVDAVEVPDWMKEEETGLSADQQILADHWMDHTKRRVIQLDYLGKRVSPYYVLEKIENEQVRLQNLLDDQDRQLYEEILFDSVGNKLRSRIQRAENWTEKMDQMMQQRVSTSGLSFSVKWRPRTAETEKELDTRELVDLLRRDPRLLKDEDINKVIGHFRSRIDRAKKLIDEKGEGNTLLQILKEVLDYRKWFSFVLYYRRENEPKRELTNHAFFQFSGGEKAMAMYIPLFTAAFSRYLEADPTAPYIISLDEAFAGVDEENINSMFSIVEELEFDYIMNSQILWGDYETVPELSICELVRPRNQDYVTVIRYHWDGKNRTLLVNKEKDLEIEQV